MSLFTLIREFTFGLVLPGVQDITWRNQAVVLRPFLHGTEKLGQKLLLYVEVHVPDERVIFREEKAIE